MNALHEGRSSAILAMFSFFIVEFFGITTNNSLSIYGGFIFTGISAMFVIFLTLLIDRNERRIIK